jgi:hypothetical protein
MMNCREGLTLRAGGAARSDWKMKTDNINMKIARQVVFIGGWRIIIEGEVGGRARTGSEIFLWQAEKYRDSPLFEVSNE